MLCPPGSCEPPQGELLKAIERDFGSLDAMIAKFNAQTAAVQGSGWGWLGYNTEKKVLSIATTSNQDPLQATTGLVPLLGVDVWEHAYVRDMCMAIHGVFPTHDDEMCPNMSLLVYCLQYLQYKNVRPDYLKEIWKVVNWDNVAERLKNASA